MFSELGVLDTVAPTEIIPDSVEKRVSIDHVYVGITINWMYDCLFCSMPSPVLFLSNLYSANLFYRICDLYVLQYIESRCPLVSLSSSMC